ncbi:DUF3616 domain-containing protein [Leptothoe sp. PORK10 BA2]|uniref:DUF3616 domain-containing protein n=1 Tax=Leptothoe sp. PORK10 BA2 TaxID=3110254 RepID=UPI002B2130B7|nr:DUF3616 domain-containing protein [Leptothoe sp. PORK10 BA2]MEA5463686.1 DUF3616 domain-containing protein [Leptothoe sp. PORK10 BA2]
MPIISQIVTFSGKIHQGEDLSAIANFTIDGTPYLAVGSDESKKQLQLLKQTADQVYTIDQNLEIELPTPDDGNEIDIESIAFDPDNTQLYIIGSHSQKRQTVKIDKKTAAENRQRLADANIAPETDRNRIFQVTLKPKTGKVKGEIKTVDYLKTLFAQDDYLKRFIDIPSKENGIDIEGLAYQKGQLFLGFRGPILRGNYVPVMVIDQDAFDRTKALKTKDLKAKDPKPYELRFVQLNGGAIRDMTAVDDGFLIIGGPMGDAPGPYNLYFWDGTDMVYGKDRLPPMPPALIQLENIQPPLGDDGTPGKPEGITVLEETITGYKALIIYDGIKGGGPQLWHIPKP